MATSKICIGILLFLSVVTRNVDGHRCDCFIKDCMKYQAGSHPRCACCVYYTLGKRSSGMPAKRDSGNKESIRRGLLQVLESLRSNSELRKAGRFVDRTAR